MVYNSFLCYNNLDKIYYFSSSIFFNVNHNDCIIICSVKTITDEVEITLLLDDMCFEVRFFYFQSKYSYLVCIKDENY